MNYNALMRESETEEQKTSKPEENREMEKQTIVALGGWNSYQAGLR